MPSPKWIIALLMLSALPAAAEPMGPLKMAELSARLYAAGTKAGDPVMIATAARLRKSAGFAPQTPLGWQEMLATAEVLAAKEEGDVFTY